MEQIKMTYNEMIIDIAIKKLKKNTKCKPIEESVLNLYIHDICNEMIKEFHLNIRNGMNNKYLKFFDEIKDRYYNE